MGSLFWIIHFGPKCLTRLLIIGSWVTVDGVGGDVTAEARGQGTAGMDHRLRTGSRRQ